jgi:hypothetical protein
MMLLASTVVLDDVDSSGAGGHDAAASTGTLTAADAAVKARKTQ